MQPELPLTLNHLVTNILAINFQSTNANLTMLQPTIFKRLLAALYDSFLILATVFIATALTLPFTKGNISPSNNIYMSVYLLTVIYIFCAWFWTHGGQTLGMRVWKQRLISTNGCAISWQQSFIRFITAIPAWLLFIVGIILWAKSDLAASISNIPGWVLALTGFIWILLNAKANNWRDKLSDSYVIIVD